MSWIIKKAEFRLPLRSLSGLSISQRWIPRNRIASLKRVFLGFNFIIYNCYLTRNQTQFYFLHSSSQVCKWISLGNAALRTRNWNSIKMCSCKLQHKRLFHTSGQYFQEVRNWGTNIRIWSIFCWLKLGLGSCKVSWIVVVVGLWGLINIQLRFPALI